MVATKKDIGKYVSTYGSKGNGVIVGVDSYKSALVLLDGKSAFNHNGHTTLNKNVGKEHPWHHKLEFFTNWKEINTEPETMVIVEGKEYSESTIKNALKSYVEE